MELMLNENHFVIKRMQDGTEVDIEYIKNFISGHSDVKVYVGTDSQNRTGWTNFACCIVLHFDGKGGHVLYGRKGVHRINDEFNRLWQEVCISVELATHLKENGIKVDFVDLDYNIDPQYMSNRVLQSALGYVKGSGFIPRPKPNTISSVIADVLCR